MLPSIIEILYRNWAKSVKAYLYHSLKEMGDIGRKNDILTFYNFIYQNATIYLSRKKEKFEQYFQLNKMI